MATVSPASRETLIAGLAVLGLALVFGVRQWLEHRRRPGAGSEAEARYNSGQDRRRGLGVTLMGLAATLMLASTRIDPRRSRADARLWIGLWLLVLVLMLVLVVLAGFDWAANRREAHRQRRALEAEQRALLAEAARLRLPTERNGRASPSDPGP